MTLEEFNAKFDDEHQLKFYAVSVLDGDGEDDRRTAKIIHHVTIAVMNAVRMSGHKAEDRFFRSENDYMPEHWRQHVRHLGQTWEEQRKILGFE